MYLMSALAYVHIIPDCFRAGTKTIIGWCFCCDILKDGDFGAISVTEWSGAVPRRSLKWKVALNGRSSNDTDILSWRQKGIVCRKKRRTTTSFESASRTVVLYFATSCTVLYKRDYSIYFFKRRLTFFLVSLLKGFSPLFAIFWSFS